MMKLRLERWRAWSFSRRRGSRLPSLSRAIRAAAAAVPDKEEGEDVLLNPVARVDTRLMSVGQFDGALLRLIPIALAVGEDEDGVRLRVNKNG